MKQKYVKPTLIVERFTLTQSIATSCGAPGGTGFGPNHANAINCTWSAYDVEFFITSNNCYEGPESNEDIFELDGYCYNNPTDQFAMFSS